MRKKTILMLLASAMLLTACGSAGDGAKNAVPVETSGYEKGEYTVTLYDGKIYDLGGATSQIAGEEFKTNLLFIDHNQFRDTVNPAFLSRDSEESPSIVNTFYSQQTLDEKYFCGVENDAERIYKIKDGGENIFTVVNNYNELKEIVAYFVTKDTPLWFNHQKISTLQDFAACFGEPLFVTVAREEDDATFGDNECEVLHAWIMGDYYVYVDTMYARNNLEDIPIEWVRIQPLPYEIVEYLRTHDYRYLPW